MVVELLKHSTSRDGEEVDLYGQTRPLPREHGSEHTFDTRPKTADVKTLRIRTHNNMPRMCICILAVLAECPGCKREAEAPVRPNVILISVDTLRADHLGCYGYSRETSPHIDSLADQGIRFSTALSQASWTLPSHISIMTSQYPHVHGVEEGTDALPEAATTIAEVLAGEGYATAGIISWIYLAKKFGFSQGFDEFIELLPPDELVDATTRASFKAEQVTDRAIAWLRKNTRRPFFLFVHYFDPHMDYEPPPPFDRMFDPQFRGEARTTYLWLRRYIKGIHLQPDKIDPRDLQYVNAMYDGEIRYTDTHLDRLFAGIDEKVGLDNCLVVFTSDHGEEFDDHGSMEGHQWTLYEEVVHVPLIFRLPSGSEAGRVVDTPVELIDIAPTILGLLALDQPKAFQGNDMSRLLSANTEGRTPGLVYGSIRRFNRKQYVRGRRYKLIHTDDIGYNKRGVPVKAGYELFNLTNDPNEQRNTFDPAQPIAKVLMRELRRHMESRGPSADRSGAPEVQLTTGEIEQLRSLGYVD